MKYIVLIILFLISLPTDAQFLSQEDFHSEFEQKAFKHVSQGNNFDPLLLFVIAKEEVKTSDYQKLLFQLHLEIDGYKAIKSEFKKEEKYLKYVYRQLRKNHLESYKLYDDLVDLLNNGSYNCISGTALFSYVFANLGYEISIIEAPFHAFMQIRTTEKDYLIEATDPAFGFISSQRAIRDHKDHFKAATQTDDLLLGLGMELDSSEESEGFLNEISLMKLAGLQYYNHGVVALNASDADKALKNFKKAAYLYPSMRTVTMVTLCEKVFLASH